jgi:hypothetical protein
MPNAAQITSNHAKPSLSLSTNDLFRSNGRCGDGYESKVQTTYYMLRSRTDPSLNTTRALTHASVPYYYVPSSRARNAAKIAMHAIIGMALARYAKSVSIIGTGFLALTHLERMHVMQLQ